MPIIGLLIFVALFLVPTDAALAQSDLKDYLRQEDARQYCSQYIQGIPELVGLENTFRGKDPDGLKTIARVYGYGVHQLYALLSPEETILLETRVIQYSSNHNYSAPLPGDAADYKRCLAGKLDDVGPAPRALFDLGLARINGRPAGSDRRRRALKK
jgi:hypothetical protein